MRDIELLAQGYFRGPPALREAIDGGKLGWSLEQMKRVPEDAEGCSESERLLLRDFELLGKCLERVTVKCRDCAAQEPRLLRPGQSTRRRPVEPLGTIPGQPEGIL